MVWPLVFLPSSLLLCFPLLTSFSPVRLPTVSWIFQVDLSSGHLLLLLLSGMFFLSPFHACIFLSCHDLRVLSLTPASWNYATRSFYWWRKWKYLDHLPVCLFVLLLFRNNNEIFLTLEIFLCYALLYLQHSRNSVDTNKWFSGYSRICHAFFPLAKLMSLL